MYYTCALCIIHVCYAVYVYVVYNTCVLCIIHASHLVMIKYYVAHSDKDTFLKGVHYKRYVQYSVLHDGILSCISIVLCMMCSILQINRLNQHHVSGSVLL